MYTYTYIYIYICFLFIYLYTPEEPGPPSDFPIPRRHTSTKLNNIDKTKQRQTKSAKPSNITREQQKTTNQTTKEKHSPL